MLRLIWEMTGTRYTTLQFPSCQAGRQVPFIRPNRWVTHRRVPSSLVGLFTLLYATIERSSQFFLRWKEFSGGEEGGTERTTGQNPQQHLPASSIHPHVILPHPLRMTHAEGGEEEEEEEEKIDSLMTLK